MRLPALVSLGANLGDRAAALAAARSVLAERFPEPSASPVYESAPVGAPGSPRYLNQVVLLAAVPGPLAVLEAVRAAEARCGRTRGERFAPRTLDADVVCVGQLVSEWPTLLLPHPRAHLRAFVLAPWLDLDPRAVLVRHGPVRALLAALPAQELRWVG